MLIMINIESRILIELKFEKLKNLGKEWQIFIITVQMYKHIGFKKKIAISVKIFIRKP